jgi:hypothetical protein
VDSALATGHKLTQAIVGIVKPETILAWPRRLDKQKWDDSARERRGPGDHERACRICRHPMGQGSDRLRFTKCPPKGLAVGVAPVVGRQMSTISYSSLRCVPARMLLSRHCAGDRPPPAHFVGLH